MFPNVVHLLGCSSSSAILKVLVVPGQCRVVFEGGLNLGLVGYLGRYPIFLPEFVSYLGKRGVQCVGNGSHFSTPVLMNMCNITFKVLRLSTFVFNKCSEKKYSRLCG